MSRSVEEWIGKTDDTPIPPRVQLRRFDHFGGRCQCGCGLKIWVGEAWDCDHIIALVNGGQNRESNLQPLLTAHHREKTKRDVAIKSKTYRTRSRHLGIRKSRVSFQTNKLGPLKKKISGEVVRR